ncbi:hypothetical protein Q4R32_13590 [Morganella morganii]|nr:hypothetical protein [Morganella morganii]HBN5914370.1 hypothetical protein [Morganella morganii]HCT4931308.1 hypothetical protein [Morganella morganii]
MPADLLNHWRAFFMLEEEAAGEAGENTVVSPDISTQCNDVMRILNG